VKPLLDLSEQDIDDVKVETKYCVEKDIHFLHIQKAIAAGYPAIPVARPDEFQPGPIAIVCSGPSLADTIEEIKGFKVVLTCSGAHDFLIERGIIPTYHMETDPRAHKAIFTRNPRTETMYLIASSCHPEVFANLKGHDVRLWHVVAQNELHKMPRGHWMITGGCNVGLRALVMARLMGFRDIHVFGMDCSSDQTSRLFHANFHPNEPKTKGHRIVKVGDREFHTSDIFLECARQFFKETMLLSDARTTLHGDGLLQALAIQKMSDPKQIEKRRQFIEKRGGATIALSLPHTISQQYVELNRKLHEADYNYGGHGDRYAQIIQKLADSKGIKSILDYGCGKGALGAALDFPIWEYDPCVPGKEAAPCPADLVVCTDVLEHIEPENLAAVLEDLKRVVKLSGFFAIHTGTSEKTLADGRNTHLIQQGMDEWRAELSKYFDIAYCGMVRKSPWLYVVVSAKRALPAILAAA
jgi:uncharacterized Rossmann fold enzyme